MCVFISVAPEDLAIVGMRACSVGAPPYRGLCLKVFLENVYGYLDI